ncbi:MAG TPA: hypothetical protein VEV81_14655, partial [Pyrinomonadaceae bacterium]|nr:hypothetical protein [Pyrinomonadaceae bacterium]
AAPFALFLGGTVAVAVYLAVTFYYAPQPASLGFALLILLDGPLWVLLSFLSRGDNPLGFAVEGFLVDGTAIWFSILVLSTRSDKPTREQRLGSVAFMLAALAATASLVWPYLRDVLWQHPASMALVGAGLLESTIVRFRALNREQTLRKEADKDAAFIIVMLLLWVASMISGNVLHEYFSK